MSTPIVVTPITRSSLPQPPTAKQGSHQLLFQGAPPPPPAQTEKNDAPESPLPPISSVTSEGAADVTHGAATKKTRSSTVARKRPAANTHEAVKKATNPTAVTTRAKLEQVTRGLAKGTLNLDQHVAEKAADGTIWFERLPEDEPPKKLHEIPTDPRRNVVEFTDWQQFKGRTSIGYLLFTAQGARYWGDAATVRWLQAAELKGDRPGTAVYVVKNDKSSGLHYGLRRLVDLIDEN